MSVNSTSPAALFGGSWTQLQDRFLLGAGSSYSNGATGGASSHLHSTADHTLTTSQIPSHKHNVSSYVAGWEGWSMGDIGAYYVNYTIFENADASTRNVHRGANSNYQVSYTGGSGAHNHGNTGSTSNMPPYLVVYIWKRTA